MRRLILALICWAVDLRHRVAQLYIADLESMLSDLISARDSIDAEIQEITRRLIAAQASRDRLNAMRGQWIREVGTHPTQEGRTL